MSERVTMPALGESVTEGTVTRWLKSVGDTVEVDEPLLEVSTDKVDTEIPSPVSGTLQEILVEEDETVEVGADLAVVGDGAAAESSDSDSGSAAADEPAEAPESSPAPEDAPDAGATGPDSSAGAPEATTTDTQAEPAAAPAPSGGEAGGDGQRVTMPALGESVTEGTVSRWLKSEGDTVEVDEPLLEVSTDKVDTEIPSPVAGTLTSILVQEDETVEVGADLAVIGGSAARGDSAPSEQPAEDPAAQSSESEQPAQAEQPSADEAQATADRPASETIDTDDSPQTDEALPTDGEGGDVADQPAGGADTGSEQAASAEAPAAATASVATQTAPSSAGASSTPQPASSGSASSPSGSATSSGDSGDQGGASGGQGDGDASAYVTPLVRKLAAQHGVDLASLTGSGIGGRIRKQDVLAAAEKSAEAPAQETAADQGGAAQSAPAAAASSVSSDKRGTREKMSRLRKVIAQRMTESLQVSAQLTTVVEVDMTKVARVRDAAKGGFERREGTKLTFLPFIALATAEALKQHPVVNASVEGEEIVYHGQENLAIAVDTERGLLTPVVKQAGDLNVAGLARAIADLAERTRENKITPDDLSGGTFTITNTGSRGALFDTPILNQPQVAMLGTGAIVRRPVVVTDVDGGETIAVRSMMYLALSYDHRIVDGADAARFLATVKARLEDGAFEA